MLSIFTTSGPKGLAVLVNQGGAFQQSNTATVHWTINYGCFLLILGFIYLSTNRKEGVILAEVTDSYKRATFTQWRQAKLCFAPRWSIWISFSTPLLNNEYKKKSKASLTWEGQWDQMFKLINIGGLHHLTRSATKTNKGTTKCEGTLKWIMEEGKEKYRLWS